MNSAIQHISSAYMSALKYPKAMLMALLVLLIAASYSANDFYYDASADTLVAEDDPELAYYREIVEEVGDETALILTFSPKSGTLFSDESVALLQSFEKDLEAIKGVSEVTTLLDAPLLKSPPIPLSEMASNFRTLLSDDVEYAAAQSELTSSPLFRDLLISTDGKSTAIRVRFDSSPALTKLFKERQSLRLMANPTREDKAHLKDVEAAYLDVYKRFLDGREKIIVNIKSVRDTYTDGATIYLGGLPLIASDMISYVQSDIIIFGSGTLLLMMLTLFMFYRKIRWVIIPMALTLVTAMFSIGILGALEKPVTVVSSNFISILVILSVSIAVHLINKYRETLEQHPELTNRELVHKTFQDKFAPCFYTTLTTMVGFASLATSTIVPVKDFGLIMCMGVWVAFIVAYTLMPAILLLLPKEKLTETTRDNNTPMIRYAYRLAAKKTNVVLWSVVVIIALTAAGLSKLSLENRFLDYFASDTEIYKGLAFIDENLGGTVPMDIIINFPPYEEEEVDEDDEFFDDFGGDEEDAYPERYWFTPAKLDRIRDMENYLNSRPEIGKVISLATLEVMARDFNDGQPLGAVEIVSVLGAAPDAIRQDFVAPYASPRNGYMRISTRIKETYGKFSRDEMIQEIEDYAVYDLGFDEGQVRVTGMNVLFNGMLKKLFESQASTLGFVIGATFLMFTILLRCYKMAIIGLFPNVIAAFMILGFMGIVGIPLDMMTITIASIVIGIGVDDAIHYLYHFRENLIKSNGDVDFAVRHSHRFIGRALYMTSVTVMIGFSILCASQFVPTVYFGLLAALAMALALFANLTILPALLIRFYRVFKNS